MQFDWWTFAFQVVNVLVLIWLLGRFLFAPVGRIVAERKAETASVLRDAEAARTAATQAREAAIAEREKIEAERFRLLEAARADAQKQAADLVTRAKAQAAEIVDRAKQAASHTEADERRQRVRRAAELSVSMTRRLLGDLPADMQTAGYAGRLAEALSALDAQQLAEMAQAPGDLRLVAPRPLRKAEVAAVRKAIGKLVDLGDDIRVDVDPSLIAGIELHSRHGVVHNSLKFDLARMAEAMANDDQA